MTDFISRKLDAVDTDGRPFEMTIRIAAPRPHPQGDWTCQVQITELFEPARALFGIDSWQAMQICLQMTLSVLLDFVARGGQLFYAGTRQPVAPLSLFAKPLASMPV